jgi:hypothetical protein
MTEDNRITTETSTNQNDTKGQNEVEMPSPQKENKEITTGNDNQNEQGSNTQQNDNQKPEQNSNGGDDKRKSDETERRERESTTPTYQDANQNADWQQDKINEANNEKGNSVDEKGKPHNKNQEVNKEASVSGSEKEKGKLGDTRKDSITERPKTETYEKKTDNDTWKSVNNGNKGHTDEEQKRERQNKNPINQ